VFLFVSGVFRMLYRTGGRIGCRWRIQNCWASLCSSIIHIFFSLSSTYHAKSFTMSPAVSSCPNPCSECVLKDLQLVVVWVCILTSIIYPSVSLAVEPCLHFVTAPTKALLYSTWGINALLAVVQVLRYYCAFYEQHKVRPNGVGQSGKSGKFRFTVLNVHTANVVCMFLTMSAAFSWLLFWMRMSLDAYVLLAWMAILILWTGTTALAHLDKYCNISMPPTKSKGQGCERLCPTSRCALYVMLDVATMVGLFLYVLTTVWVGTDFRLSLVEGIPSEECRLLNPNTTAV